jgi:pyruvate formate lyase activating enzyme
MKEAYFYKVLEENKVQCSTCSHFCVLPLGEKGKCGVRKNIEGKLYSLTYEKIVALNIDPVEKKPLFHFLPGTDTLSVATVGCPFFCKNCQNWPLSQTPKETSRIEGEKISPEEVVKIAKKHGLKSISYTYTDPTAFLEYALDIMKLAKGEGLKNIFVCNGYISPEAAQEVIPYLDAINIDIKNFSEDFYEDVCGAKLGPVLDTVKLMKRSKIWIEITTLAIPTLSDSNEMFQNISKFIYSELGSEVPWHISRFSGSISWKLQHLSETPIERLEMAYEIGKNQGLKYIYAGNLYGNSLENTFCPNCRALCIDRTTFKLCRYDKEGMCPECGENINLILN